MDQLLSTESKALPPGFRFHPTDEELFLFYLKRKVMRKSLSPRMMSEVDVYRFPPWDLPDKSWMKTRDLSWYFFCPRSKKYAHGARTNRSTEHGYWKSTGNDRTVEYNHRPVGKIKTLIFHLGKPPKGERTDWVMHEYRLEDRTLVDKGIAQDSYVICKVYKKSGLGPKNGEHYGAPFVEEEWETDDDDENLETGGGLPLAPEGENQSASDITNALPNHDCVTASTTSNEQQITQNNGSVLQLEIDPTEMIEGDELEKLLAMFTEDDIDTPTDGTKKVVEHTDNDVYNGLEDLADGSQASQMGFDWSQLGDIGKDYYIQLEDRKSVV